MDDGEALVGSSRIDHRACGNVQEEDTKRQVAIHRMIDHKLKFSIIERQYKNVNI